MRNVLTFFFLANIALGLISLVVLPAEVAIHFGLGGEADGWASRETNALLFMGIAVPLFLALLYGPLLTMKINPRYMNIPNKDYWLREENRPVFAQKLRSLTWEFGASIFVFLGFIQVLTIHANLLDPVRINETVLFVALGLLMAYSAWWCFRFYRDFRIPKSEESFPNPNTQK